MALGYHQLLMQCRLLFDRKYCVFSVVKYGVFHHPMRKFRAPFSSESSNFQDFPLYSTSLTDSQVKKYHLWCLFVFS